MMLIFLFSNLLIFFNFTSIIYDNQVTFIFIIKILIDIRLMIISTRVIFIYLLSFVYFNFFFFQFIKIIIEAG